MSQREEAEAPVHSERTLLDLIGLIYDAAGDSSRWPAFLEKLRRPLNSSASNLFSQDLRSQEFSFVAAAGMDPAYQRAYENYYRKRNVYLIRGNHLLRTGHVCVGPEMCSDAVALRSEFYNDWIAPQKQRHGMLGVIFRERSLTSMIGAIRPKGAALFDADDMALMQLLIPHLQRAISLDRRITQLETQKAAASDALDRWSLGVILLDHQGHVLLMNRSAEAMVRRKDGLSLEDMKLRAGLPSETAALRALAYGAIRTSSGKVSRPGGGMTISRATGERPLNILVTPLVAHKAFRVTSGTAAIVFVGDPEDCGETDEELLSQFFGLSHAEARVASLLVEGKSVNEMSQDLQVTLNTVRTHLKKVFEKTNTRRQTEVAELILRAPVSSRLREQPHPFG